MLQIVRTVKNIEKGKNHHENGEPDGTALYK